MPDLKGNSRSNQGSLLLKVSLWINRQNLRTLTTMVFPIHKSPGKGDALHSLGFHGEGKVIAIQDAGFQNANIIPAFDSLRNNGQILAPGFCVPGNNVYNEFWHGTSVLSIMGGNLPGTLIGTPRKQVMVAAVGGRKH